MIKICDHSSVGMLIRNDGDAILFIERKLPPFGFAPPAGHVDKHGSYEKAVISEVEEEVGLTVEELKLVAEGRKDNCCRRTNGNWHYWKIYEVKTSGNIKANSRETKQIQWLSSDKLIQLSEKTKKYLLDDISEKDWRKNPGLEPVWFEWLIQLKII